MATEYATLVFKADTKEIGQAYNQLRKLNAQGKISDQTFKAFERQLKTVNQEAKKSGTAFGGMGRSAGQAGIQIQQLVGQIQGGTNPMLALSQQSADLGFVLGAPLLGAVAGLASSLAMVLLPTLLQGSDSMEDMREKAEELADSVGDLTDAQREYFALLDQRQVQELTKQIASLKEEMDALGKSVNDISAGDIMMESFEAASVATEKDREAKLALQAQIDTLQQEIDDLNDGIDKYNGKISVSKEETEKQAEAIRQLVLDLTLQEQKLIMGDQAFAGYKAQLAGANQAVYEFVMATTASIEALKEQKKASDEADAFLEKLEKQANTMSLSKAGALSLEAATHSLSQAELERVAVLIQQIDLEEKRVAKQKESAKAIKDLEKSGLLNAEKDQYDSYQRRAKALEEYRSKQLISEAQYNEAKKNLETQARDHAIQSAGDALNALGQYNKTAFAAAKAFNIGQAVMNTYTGATKALAAYPPPFNFIAAAAVVASGLAQVQMIRSQQYQGRAVGGQVRAGESYVVGERGAEVLTMGSSNGRIIPNDKLGGGSQQVVNRNINVSFQISTVDARGFDSLLQSRKGQIIGMINTAMNERGSRGLT